MPDFWTVFFAALIGFLIGIGTLGLLVLTMILLRWLIGKIEAIGYGYK